MQCVLISLISLALYASSTLAADIQVIEIPGTSNGIISVKGHIMEGDASRFRDAVRKFDRASVFLESPGGLVYQGLEIGNEIRRRDFATVVTDECYSICGIIWLAGARRYMARDAKIGFHAAYGIENGEQRESGVANAVVGAYLTKWGFRIEAVEYVTKTGPEDILVLTPEAARIIGVELYQEDSSGFKSPLNAPTVDMYAQYYLVYQVMERICADLFQVDVTAILRARDDAERAGSALVGNSKFGELVTSYLDIALGDIREKGGVQVCLGIASDLLDRSMPIGITGPSFPCSAAATQAELAICSDRYLWAKDRATSAIFHYIRGYKDARIRRQMLADQRAWLRERNACGENRDCLHVVYDNRLKAFRDVNVSRADHP